MLICVAHARAHTQASLKSIRTCWLWRTCESTSRNPATYEKTPRPYARGIQEACCNTVSLAPRLLSLACCLLSFTPGPSSLPPARPSLALSSRRMRYTHTHAHIHTCI